MTVILLIVIGIVLIYGLYLYYKTKDIFNPILIFIGPIFVGYFIFLWLYYDSTINNLTLIFYMVGILFYVFGFVICRVTYKYSLKFNRRLGERELVVSNCVFNLYKVISIIAIITTFAYVVKMAFAGPFGNNIIRNLRYMGNYTDNRGFVSVYGMVILKVTLEVIIYQVFVQNNKSNKKWLPLLFIGVLIGIFATVARTEIIEITIAIYYIYSANNRIYSRQLSILKKLKQKYKALILIILIALVFVWIVDRTGKLGSSSILDREFFLYRYLGQELKNFDSYVLGNAYSTRGYYSFGIIGKLLSAFGMGPNNELFLTIQELYHGPVCSFIAAPYADFGLLGILITMFIQGFFHSYIYMKNLQEGRYWTIIYTSCIYSNIMAFYAFQYLMSSQVYILIVIIILHIEVYQGKVSYKKSAAYKNKMRN